MWEKNYKFWIENKYIRNDIKKEIKTYSKNKLKEAFATDLEFGTAGLRAKMGYGSAYFNIINVRRAALAFALFLKNKFPKKDLETKGVLIGHDNRKFSNEFALETANILANYNIKTILFYKNISVPTPFVSYGINKLKFISGIVITASHNPKEYNGFKIFDENGCQYLPNETLKISEKYKNNFMDAVNFISKKESNKFIKYLDKNFQENYFKDTLDMQYLSKLEKKIKIVFSNLHGTGQKITPEIFKRAKYDYVCVKEQYDLDSDFKMAPNPNPELEENYLLATKYAKKNNADVIILNDPDADRVGISILHNKKYHILYANDISAILLIYIINQIKDSAKINNSIVYSTFVSSDLTDLIAKSYNICVKKTLTGFKWMGNEMIKNQNKNFLLSYEESSGFILNKLLKDKDGIQTSLIIVEAVNYYKNQNKTFIDVLNELHKKYGYFYFETINKFFNDKKDIINLMSRLRKINIKNILHLKITKKEDYLNGLYGMPSENLLKFYFNNDSWFAVRPSGTEPKIKFYFVFKSLESFNNSKIQLKAIKEELFNIILKKK